MASTVADFMLDRLEAWGIKRIYGFPGDGITGIVSALDRAEERFEFIQTRHEESAAFMAGAHAKWTGEVGVCLATSGPGAIHLLNGLYDAKLDHQPVLAIVGQQARAALGGHYQQEVDLVSLFKDVAHEYVHMCTVPAQMRHLIDRALRTAMAMRCVTCIIVPNDVQELDAVEVPPRKHGTVHSGVGYKAPRVVPAERDLIEAAAALNEGRKVAMLIGAGALGAEREVIEVADMLGAGVAKALLGKAALPDDLPFVTGQIGLLGTKPSWDLMMGCDTLFMVGSGFPYSEFLPKEGAARGVQIDIDPKMLSIRYPMEVNLVGDAAATLQALLPHLKRKEDRSWREKVEGWVEDWWQDEEGRARMEADPINPEFLFWELSPRLPENAIVAADSGTSANWFARALKMRSGMMASLSGGLATHVPGRAVRDGGEVRLSGPGGDRLRRRRAPCRMLGINGLITIAKYWRRWSNPRLVVAVLNNNDLNPGDLGAAGDGVKPEGRRDAKRARLRLRRLRRTLGLEGHPRRPPGGGGAGLGGGRSPPTGRPSSTPVSTPTCRPCRRTSRWPRRRAMPRRSPRATRTRAGSSGSRSSACSARTMAAAAPIQGLRVEAYRIPTDRAESDGTLAWDSTTLVLVEAQAGGETGVGYTYAHAATGTLIADKLAPVVRGKDALATNARWHSMVHALRNEGRPGIAAAAVSAVDNALWDLKGRLLGAPVVQLLGAARERVPVYGSGGFTSYTDGELQEQLGGWAADGMAFVKMKIGREPMRDVARVEAARAAIGAAVDLFVDANGAYARKEALAFADRFRPFGVTWFEEPVSSDDLEGLRLIRDRAPPPIEVSAGEYGYTSWYFRRMLEAGAVDVLQADATRCCGITGFMQAAALCEAFQIPLSSHCGPALHLHPCCAALRTRHMEWFHDHVRIEHMLFDGAPVSKDGHLAPDLSRPGLGLDFKHKDAARYAV